MRRQSRQRRSPRVDPAETMLPVETKLLTDRDCGFVGRFPRFGRRIDGRGYTLGGVRG